MCLVLFICILALAVSGFYSGANSDKVICDPAKDGSMINEVRKSTSRPLLFAVT